MAASKVNLGGWTKIDRKGFKEISKKKYLLYIVLLLEGFGTFVLYWPLYHS